jgi:hypothetical protein
MNKDTIGGAIGVVWTMLMVLLLITSIVKGCADDPGPKTYEGTTETNSDLDWQVKWTGKQELRKTLRDPDSLQIISETTKPDGPGRTIYRCHYRAKNGFGGYQDDTFSIRVNH